MKFATQISPLLNSILYSFDRLSELGNLELRREQVEEHNFFCALVNYIVYFSICYSSPVAKPWRRKTIIILKNCLIVPAIFEIM